MYTCQTQQSITVNPIRCVLMDTRHNSLQSFRKDSSARYLFSCKHRQVCHGDALLQQSLTTLCVSHPCTAKLPPGLVPLKVQAYTVQCHTGTAIHPGIVGKNMIHQAVNTCCVILVSQCF